MKRHYLRSSIFLPVLLFMGDCQSTPYQSPPEPTWYTWNDVGLVHVSRTTRRITADSSAIADTVYAFFREEDSVGMEAGAVSFESLMVPMYQNPSDTPAVFYRLTSEKGLLPIRLGGAQHVIRVSGKGAMAAYERSITSPSAIRIVQPARGAEVSKRDGFEILYIDPFSHDDYFEAEIHPAGSPGARGLKLSLTNEQGFVDPAMLASAPPGLLDIVVRQVVNKVDTIQGRTYRTRFSSALRYTVSLVE